MKHLKSIALIVLISLLTFCTNQRPEKSRDREYTIAELIGKWNQVSTKKSRNDRDPKIEFIQLFNDSVAEVQILDSTGVRKVFGKWENRFKKEIKKMNIKLKAESDIKITYSLGDNHKYTLLLKLGEENKKAILSAYNDKFEKE